MAGHRTSPRLPVRTHLSARLLAVGLLIALGAGSGISHADDTGRAPAGKTKPQTYALLIGCTDYSGLKGATDLHGCLNDVVLMEKTLVERLSVRADNVKTLAGWEADAKTRPTGANIRAALETLAKRKYGPGDLVIVHYSGHGVQQTDDNADETDGLDEAWLVSDSRRVKKVGLVGTLRDEEIGEYLRRIRDRGATVWCIMDCCHSATGTRGVTDAETRYRGVDPAVLGIDMKPAATRADVDSHEHSPMGAASDSSERLVVFYAAQSFQTVPEIKLQLAGSERKSYGLLTSRVVRALLRSGNHVSFAGLYEQVVAGYRDLSLHHEVQPLAEGDLTLSVYGKGRGVQPLFVRKGQRRTLEVSAGALHGLSKGTELDVYDEEPGAGENRKLGRVVVHRLGPESSVVRPVKGDGGAWTKGKRRVWPAVVSKYVMGDTTLPIALVNEKGKPLESSALSADVRADLTNMHVRSRCPIVERSQAAKWVVVVGADGEPVGLQPAQRGRAAPLFEVTSRDLTRRLLQIYTGENLLKLAARAPEMRLPSNIFLTVSRGREAGGKRTPVRSGARIPPGSFLDVGLVKEDGASSKDLDAVDAFVFWIDPHFGIYKLFPSARASQRLTVDDTAYEEDPIRVGDEELQTSDESQGIESFLVIVAEARNDTTHLDLSFLEHEPLQLLRTRGVGTQADDAVASLLRDVAYGTTGTRGPTKPIDRGTSRLRMGVFTFETSWGPIHIPEPSSALPSATIKRTFAKPVAPDAPDAWRFGPDVHFARAGLDKACCLVVARGDGAVHALLDLTPTDEGGGVPARQRTQACLKGIVTEKTFDAEMAIRIEKDRIVIWYDADDDGTFDLALVDGDKDHRAEERYVRTKTGWKHDRDIDAPVLGTGHLAYMREAGGRATALDRISTLAGD